MSLFPCCTQLKNSVLAAQGSPQAPPASVQALQQQLLQQRGSNAHKGKPAINAQTAAHLHGVVRLDWAACQARSRRGR